jgi:hypothetical protein
MIRIKFSKIVSMFCKCVCVCLWGRVRNSSYIKIKGEKIERIFVSLCISMLAGGKSE